ncbi:fatty-acyl-CoA synthase [Gordonia hydrophobica]|nr:fatty-acyl-CoA synthase [Gordonia hydrophobica]
MYPGTFAATTPDKPAVIRPATGEQVTYAELMDRSTRIANHLRGLGVGEGDTIAIVSDNDLRIFDVYWAAVRSGMYVTAVNHHLTPGEVNYILDDCGQGRVRGRRRGRRGVPRTRDPGVGRTGESTRVGRSRRRLR